MSNECEDIILQKLLDIENRITKIESTLSGFYIIFLDKKGIGVLLSILLLLIGVLLRG